MPQAGSRPQRIAVLGGGVGALSAVFSLTDAPDWGDRYEITLYQVGWRLGGKGASGRGAARGDRIEEHGLHLWAGFYDNAFHMIRRCYDELARPADAPLATWREAFIPLNHFHVADREDDKLIPWRFHFPSNGIDPGDISRLPSLWECYVIIVNWLKSLQAGLHLSRSVMALQPTIPAWVLAELAALGVHQQATTLSQQQVSLIDLAARLSVAMPLDPAAQTEKQQEALTWLLQNTLDWLRDDVEHRVSGDTAKRRRLILLVLGAASTLGMLSDGVLIFGFDHIDDRDWRTWMRQHGATDLALNSAVVRGCYDYAFAYQGGDPNSPAVAAGTGMRGLIRLALTYKGSVFYKMAAGMGDVVFAPLYQLLKRRGVKFRFFHRVENLGLASNGQSIEQIVLGRQADVSAAEYDPLVDVKGLPCWPAQPRYEQLVQGSALSAGHYDLESARSMWPDVGTTTLRSGVHYDLVVLGISIGAFPQITKELMARSYAWRKMVQRVETTPTQSLQLWSVRNLAGLGWTGGSTVMTAGIEPQDTWADMTHLLPMENWPIQGGPLSIAYFCSPLLDVQPIPPPSESGFPDQQRARVKADAVNWIRKNLRELWPDSVIGGTQDFDWDVLYCSTGKAGANRINCQYWRANVNPSDRYVLSIPGSTRFRLPAGESGFRNLYLAGDWVRNGINAGCVEAAVMAGMDAARAITGSAIKISGESGW